MSSPFVHATNRGPPGLPENKKQNKKKKQSPLNFIFAWDQGPGMAGRALWVLASLVMALAMASIPRAQAAAAIPVPPQARARLQNL